MSFFKKKSNIIMVVVIAVLVIAGIVGAFAMGGDRPSKEAEAIVQEQVVDAESEADVSEDAQTKENVEEEAAEPKEAVEVNPREIPEEIPEATPTAEPEGASEVEQEVTPEVETETTPETTPQVTPEKTPETTPETTPEPTMTPTATPTATPTPTPEPTPAAKTCTITICCDEILSNMGNLAPGKEGLIPSSGYIMSNKTIEFSEGETVLDILVRACDNSGVQLEYAYTPAYDSYYVEGINNIYEFDCGPASGWKYRVNGTYPNYGCSGYAVSEGDSIVWNFSCTG